MSRSIVFSNRIAPISRLPLNAGLVIDARAHLVHDVEHLLLVLIGVLVDAVELQRLRRAAAALVERRDETLVVLDLGQLLVEVAHETAPFGIRWLDGEAAWARATARGVERVGGYSSSAVIGQNSAMREFRWLLLIAAAAPAVASADLPPDIERVLTAHKIPPSDVSVLVEAVDADAPILSHLRPRRAAPRR